MSAIAESRGVGVGESISHTLLLTRRNLLHIRTDPEQLVGMTIQPLMFLLLFVYVFGGAISGSSSAYLQFALPGILVQSISFVGFYTGLGLNSDFQKGLIDRFRSLPIARSAVISGRILSDAARVVWSIVIIAGFGVLLGFRFGNGIAGALGAALLLTAFGIAMCWPMAFMGILAKTPEAVNTWGFMLILPLTFASTVFVPAESMPGWLEVFVNVNPITHISDATRGLMLGGDFAVATPIVWSIIWIVVLHVVFVPLTVSRYRRKV